MNKHIMKNLVPNTHVDICYLIKSLGDISQDYSTFVEYLILCISEDVIVSDTEYRRYLLAAETNESTYSKYDSREETVRDIIMNAIMS